jgi:hypothetical protein
MKLRHHLMLALALTASALSVSAQTMKPGLWEVKNKMSTSSGELEKAMAMAQKEMAKMPADQRKMMEDMMAKQGIGIGMGAGTPSIEMCMTKEMIERNEVTAQQGDCQHTALPLTSNTMKFSFVCSQPPSSGEGQVTFVSPEAYTLKMQLKTQTKGKTETMTMDASGQFMSSECGAIKPINALAK